MTQPILTIGMAVYDDFDGVWFTIQHIRTTNDCHDIEFVVVDNKPDSRVSRHIQNFLGNCQQGTAGARYIPMPSPVGTSAPRNRVFSEAMGNYVVCMDSHVISDPGSFNRLILYYQEHGSRDLLSGPLLYDNLQTISTHFNDEWRGGMWGTWGQAWMCRCKRMVKVTKNESPLAFTVLNENDQCSWRGLANNKIRVNTCDRCGRGLPESLPYNGHEDRLRGYGFVEMGQDKNDAPFEVPGQGLGLFSCRKEDWLWFNEQFRGFGGEEMYIHQKFRNAGKRALCLPFLRWAHRFYRAENKYPLNIYDRVRNYVIGHKELGLDLAPVRKEFVDSGQLPIDQWNRLVVD